LLINQLAPRRQPQLFPYRAWRSMLLERLIVLLHNSSR
jgi:hypothetical protein